MYPGSFTSLHPSTHPKHDRWGYQCRVSLDVPFSTRRPFFSFTFAIFFFFCSYSRKEIPHVNQPPTTGRIQTTRISEQDSYKYFRSNRSKTRSCQRPSPTPTQKKKKTNFQIELHVRTSSYITYTITK